MIYITWKDYTPDPDAIELCPWDEDIAGYVSGKLSKKVSDKLREHLGRCHGCADRERKIREEYEIFQPTDDERARLERFAAITQVVKAWREDSYIASLGREMWDEVSLRWQLSEVPSPPDNVLDVFYDVVRHSGVNKFEERRADRQLVGTIIFGHRPETMCLDKDTLRAYVYGQSLSSWWKDEIEKHRKSISPFCFKCNLRIAQLMAARGIATLADALGGDIFIVEADAGQELHFTRLGDRQQFEIEVIRTGGGMNMILRTDKRYFSEIRYTLFELGEESGETVIIQEGEEITAEDGSIRVFIPSEETQISIE